MNFTDFVEYYVLKPWFAIYNRIFGIRCFIIFFDIALYLFPIFSVFISHYFYHNCHDNVRINMCCTIIKKRHFKRDINGPDATLHIPLS